MGGPRTPGSSEGLTTSNHKNQHVTKFKAGPFLFLGAGGRGGGLCSKK